MTELKPRLSTLTLVGFYINSAIANGHINTVTFDEIYDALERKELLSFLDKKIPGEFDFSLFPPGSDQYIGFHDVLYNVAGGFEGRERRKLGLESPNHGLSLLLSNILEAIQQHDWV
jgi:hypothetical protein